MIRTILVFLLLANTLFGQDDPNSTLLFGDQIISSKTPAEGETWGERIAEGAAKSVADLETRIATLEKLVPPYIPTWTWPGHDGPEAFDRLRAHMAGENVHPARNVAKWSRAELAFIHDCDHVDEYLQTGRGLPVLKDQRLRDWLRSKSPAKALPRKIGWAVKRIVMHTMNRCSACERWKQNDMPQALADGVEVEVIADNDGLGFGGKNYPYFEVEYCSDNQCIRKPFQYTTYQTIKQTATSL